MRSLYPFAYRSLSSPKPFRDSSLLSPPEIRYIYSDLNFMSHFVGHFSTALISSQLLIIEKPIFLSSVGLQFFYFWVVLKRWWNEKISGTDGVLGDSAREPDFRRQFHNYNCPLLSPQQPLLKLASHPALIPCCSNLPLTRLNNRVVYSPWEINGRMARHHCAFGFRPQM